jgi:hypothetical protein
MAATEPQLLLPALGTFTPAKLEIHGSGYEKVTLVRTGDRWTVEDAGGYPADQKKIDDLLKKLREIKVGRPVVSSSRYHAALKVTDKEHERRFRLWEEASHDPKIGLYLGSSPNYRVTHVRREGEDRVYEVTGLGAYDVRQDRSAWIQTDLLGISYEQIQGMRLKNSHGEFELKKDPDGSWRAISQAGRKLDASKVESLVRAASSLRVSEPGGILDRKAQGFDPPAATVILHVGSPQAPTGEAEKAPDPEPTQAITLWVGKSPEGKDSQRYIARSDFGFAGIVWNSSVEKLLNQKLAELR